MKIILKIFLIFLITSCANMVAPTGGEKDLRAPKIKNISSLEGSNDGHYKVFKFEFDEYIQLNKWETYFYISPTLGKIEKKIKGKTLIVTINDTLNENTTYYLSLNSCIKDYNEGNILDTLSYKFSRDNSFDTLIIYGDLKDSYTLKPIENAWVMLFNEKENDTLIFKQTPNYIAKTDIKGNFNFPNLKDVTYKIVALTDVDFIYNEKEKIAFSDMIVNAKKDSFISLFAFNPIIEVDTTATNSNKFKIDSITDSSLALDTTLIKVEMETTGKLEIITNEAATCIFQLLQNGKVITENYFSEKPYLIDGIVVGKYQLKYIADTNQDSIWNTGNWDNKIQPEKVLNYYSEITIRANWDLQLEWFIGE